MNIIFYLSAVVAVIATFMVITRANAMHALLYMIVSLLAVALIFFTLGAPFIAALEVIVYAGAIMVLFIFAIMLLSQGTQSVILERQWLRGSNWVGPATLSLVLLVEVAYIFLSPAGSAPPVSTSPVDPRQVGATLFTTYLIGVELSSILLLASLVGAYHLGRRRQVTRTVQRQEAELTREKDQKEGEPFKPIGDKTPAANKEFQIEKER
jgi:NADH-quinone oxidoreductase subunit J